jgi:TrmH family RNA methyltransferase
MFSARVDADWSYTAVEYPQSVAIAVGNESEGLGDPWNRQEIRAVRIPMHGAIDSLNVSVSTSIVLFEIMRQHGRLD